MKEGTRHLLLFQMFRRHMILFGGSIVCKGKCRESLICISLLGVRCEKLEVFDVWKGGAQACM